MLSVLFSVFHRLLGAITEECPPEYDTLTKMVRRGINANSEGRVVEAAYWMIVSDLLGYHNLGAVIKGYVEKWERLGMPEQKEDVTREFSEEQRQFGYAALRWMSGSDRTAASGWFSRASQDGDEKASVFIRKYIDTKD